MHLVNKYIVLKGGTHSLTMERVGGANSNDRPGVALCILCGTKYQNKSVQEDDIGIRNKLTAFYSDNL
jgi:hypothetical protein